MLYRESIRQMSYLAIWRITHQSANFRVERNSNLSTAATLIVAGQMEHSLVLQSLKLLLVTLPYSCGYLAPGGRHGWIGESTDLFNRLLRAWFGEGPLPPELISVEPGRLYE